MLSRHLQEFCQVLETQQKSHRNDYIFERLIDVSLNRIVTRDVINKFVSYFNKDHDTQPYLALLDGVEFLRGVCSQMEQLFADDKSNIYRDKFMRLVKTSLLSLRTEYQFEHYFSATYLRAFKVFIEINEITIEDDEDLDDGEEGGVHLEVNCASNQLFYTKFLATNSYLRQLELIDSLAGDTVFKIASIFIEKRVSSRGKSDYSNSYLDELRVWMNQVVKRWIMDIYSFSEDDKEYASISQKLEQFLSESYAEVRKSHIFEIILEYPNSEAGIQDLKMCLENSASPEFRLNLIENVKQSLTESLLHPGVNTYDILTAYISAIKALRALDPSGLILQLVTEPVRRYLKSRDDTVKCIVTALTDEENNSELNREMIRTGAQSDENPIENEKSSASEMNMPSEGERCTLSNYEKWKPDPIKVNPSDDPMKASRFSDILSILVNIYETKDRFVEEYQKLLSQRLLNRYDDCNLDNELRNLELLTIRFSDCELHRCEVMLKDVSASKRISKRILAGEIREHKLEKFRDLDVLIVSCPFWPEKFGQAATVSDEPPVIPFQPEIEEAIDCYTKAYEALQASRTLHWRHHLGLVNMDVTINGKSQNFHVSPLHASLLYMFKERKCWRLNEFMHRTSLPAATLRSRLAYWQRNGLIQDLGEDRYELILC